MRDDKLPNVVWITATRDRSTCMERIIRFFLDQNYPGSLGLWVFNNSETPLTFKIDEPIPKNRRILVTHKHLDTFTNLPYENVGSIFNDIIDQIPNIYLRLGIHPDITTFADDDDIYLPSHITEGVKGMKESWQRGMLAYKPYYSYYRDARHVSLAHNNLEPSIFADAEYISKSKCRNTAVDYHDGWIVPLKKQNKFFVGEYPEFKPTLIYDWGQEIPVYKISGTGDNSTVNYDAYKAFSTDSGNNIPVAPISKEKAHNYYTLVKKVGRN